MWERTTVDKVKKGDRVRWYTNFKWWPEEDAVTVHAKFTSGDTDGWLIGVGEVAYGDEEILVWREDSHRVEELLVPPDQTSTNDHRELSTMTSTLSVDDVRALWTRARTSVPVQTADGADIITSEDVAALASEPGRGDTNDNGEPTDEFLAVIARQLNGAISSPFGINGLY